MDFDDYDDCLSEPENTSVEEVQESESELNQMFFVFFWFDFHEGLYMLYVVLNIHCHFGI